MKHNLFHARVLFLLAGLALLTRPAEAQTKRLVQVPISDAPSYAKRALVVGVTDYALAPQLHVCAYDAKEFAQLLKSRFGFADVTLMTDDPATPLALRPTCANLRRAVHSLLKGIVPGKSEVVLFYSGHGVRYGDSDWLVPEDGDPSDISRSCVNYSVVVQALNTERPRRAFLITDACRSLLNTGNKGIESGSGFGKGLESLPLGPEVAEMLSCQPTEVSQEGLATDFTESVFTHFLVKGLEGDPDALDGATKNVTFDSLMQYVQGHVSNYVRSRFNASQVPDGRATQGRMVLARVSGSAPIPMPPQIVVPPITPNPIIPATITPPLPVPPTGAKINPKDGAEMVYVAAGPFLMGDDDIPDNPRHTVILSGYWIYKNDVTVAMYRKFCEATGRPMPERPAWRWINDDPVVNVNWHDAKAYCDWAGVHLPTEAQWEKAARGIDGHKYPWGDSWDSSRLRYSRASYRDAGGPLPVGSLPSGASPYGGLDMAGNVCQWCADWYDANYWKSDHGLDPSGPIIPRGERHRVLRGGSWGDVSAIECRAAYRNSFALPGDHNAGNGFRCAFGP